MGDHLDKYIYTHSWMTWTNTWLVSDGFAFMQLPGTTLLNTLVWAFLLIWIPAEKPKICSSAHFRGKQRIPCLAQKSVGRSRLWCLDMIRTGRWESSLAAAAAAVAAVPVVVSAPAAASEWLNERRRAALRRLIAAAAAVAAVQPPTMITAQYSTLTLSLTPHHPLHHDV